MNARSLALLLLLALPPSVAAQTNPLLPQIHPVQPGDKPPEKAAQKAEAAKPEAPASQQSANPDGLPSITVRGSRVEIADKDGATNVYFDLSWRIESTPEAIVQVDGDLLLSDDEGTVHGRVPWTLKDEKGLPGGFDERNVGIDTSKSDTAQAWFKGAQPGWIRFAFVPKHVTFASGRVVACKACK